jgi:hypothetical protein
MSGNHSKDLSFLQIVKIAYMLLEMLPVETK